MNLVPIIKLLRPAQWLKNFMLLFPPFLGGIIVQPGVIRKGVAPLVAFCLASSATYILNDILDAENDIHHSKKQFRPIASGRVSKTSAAILALVVFVVSVAIGSQQPERFLSFLLVYTAVAVLYSLKLKEFPIIDLFCISAGFLFRLEAGGVIFGVKISEWLFLSVFLLAMFLSTGKRLGERNMLGSAAGAHRKSLLAYPDGFLDGAMYMTGSAVLVTYTMYVISRQTLIYSVPLCLFGLLRYILLVKSGKSCDPTESLYRDKMLFVVGFFWAVMVGWSLYGR